jgi:hypothetical protein
MYICSACLSEHVILIRHSVFTESAVLTCGDLQHGKVLVQQRRLVLLQSNTTNNQRLHRGQPADLVSALFAWCYSA